MLESEAEKKWCPMVRAAVQAPGKNFAPRNRVVIQEKGAKGTTFRFERTEGDNCIGSACMMWREFPAQLLGVHGYCGLAGKPEIIK